MKLPGKTVFAIVCIATIEVVALIKGVNGAWLALSIAAISGLGGFELGIRRKG